MNNQGLFDSSRMCAHSPSQRKQFWQRYFALLLCPAKYYCTTNMTAQCSCCGAPIYAPIEYYGTGKKLFETAFSILFGIGGGVWWKMRGYDHGIVGIILMCAVVIIVTCCVRMLSNAFILSFYEWQEREPSVDLEDSTIDMLFQNRKIKRVMDEYCFAGFCVGWIVGSQKNIQLLCFLFALGMVYGSTKVKRKEMVFASVIFAIYYVISFVVQLHYANSILFVMDKLLFVIMALVMVILRERLLDYDM